MYDMLCEIKFAHIRFSEYFTFAKQIFHSEAISLARKGKFHWKKPLLKKGFSAKYYLNGAEVGVKVSKSTPRLLVSLRQML